MFGFRWLAEHAEDWEFPHDPETVEPVPSREVIAELVARVRAARPEGGAARRAGLGAAGPAYGDQGLGQAHEPLAPDRGIGEEGGELAGLDQAGGLDGAHGGIDGAAPFPEPAAPRHDHTVGQRLRQPVQQWRVRAWGSTGNQKFGVWTR